MGMHLFKLHRSTSGRAVEEIYFRLSVPNFSEGVVEVTRWQFGECNDKVMVKIISARELWAKYISSGYIKVPAEDFLTSDSHDTESTSSYKIMRPAGIQKK